MTNRASTPRSKWASTPALSGCSADAPPPLQDPTAAALDLTRAATRWISDGRAQGWSARTLKDRTQMLERFCWWLEHVESLPTTLESLSPTVLRSFLAYLRDPAPHGRWGTDHHASQRETRPSTVQTYYRALRAFSNFLLEEGLLADTPLRNVKTPRVPVDQIGPLTAEQLQTLLGAARAGRNPQRDVALLLVLVDTGLRASELRSLIVADADRDGQLSVVGKGNKRRLVYMGTAARRALWQYLESADRRGAAGDEALFYVHRRHARGRRPHSQRSSQHHPEAG